MNSCIWEVYKCRGCGKNIVFKGQNVPDEVRKKYETQDLHTILFPENFPEKKVLHCCNPCDVCVCDFVGWEV